MDDINTEEAGEVVITFGKYKGTALKHLPDDYLDWLYENTDGWFAKAGKAIYESREKNSGNEEEIKKTQGFTIKEEFSDINQSELQFINKNLKRSMKLHNQPMLEKRTVKGDKWPSNQWPKELIPVTNALLWNFRQIKEAKLDWWMESEAIKELIELQIEHPARKGWDFGTTYDDGGEWMDQR